MINPEWSAKTQAMRDTGTDPYPDASHLKPTVRNEIAVQQIRDNPGVKCSLVGRVLARNLMGKSIFIRIDDSSGYIQLYANKNDLSPELFAQIQSVDIGDWIWVSGSGMVTKTGEPTLRISEFKLASKIQTPFPDTYHPITDPELRARHRYMDLMLGAENRKVFKMRSEILHIIRRLMDESGYMEVETPMLHSIQGGANAKPFVTHHNALDTDMFLRIAPELYLKKLLVGGFQRVYELNRVFRNEGLSTRHNPEFTSLESYAAWETYTEAMSHVEYLFQSVVQEVHRLQDKSIPFDGCVLDFESPFVRVEMSDLICKYTGLSQTALRDPVEIRSFYHTQHEVGLKDMSLGSWWETLFDEYVTPHLIQPTFVTGYPRSISPLARTRDSDPFLTDRFELYCATWEIANGFTELNDPEEQERRFKDQMASKNDESMPFDEEYIKALSYGMPPAAGVGIGIDRMVMLLTNKQTIKDCILFPTLKPNTSL